MMGCGSQSGTATTPSVAAASLSGTWTGTTTFAGLDGGECLGADLLAFSQTHPGPTPIILVVQQSGSNVTATESSPNNPSGTWSYTGTATATGLSLVLQSCSTCNLSGAACANGQRRDTRLLTGSLTATTDGHTMTASSVKTYNVFASSGTAVLGVMTGTTTETLTKQ